jgi:hypothetical protein
MNYLIRNQRDTTSAAKGENVMERDSIITLEKAEDRQESVRSQPPANTVPNMRDDGFSGPLLAHDASEEMRLRWESIQARFVDDPSTAVKDADELVTTATKRLSDTFASERAKLEQQWSQGNDVSTEDLRLALRRYRAFFHRLLVV